MRVRDTDGKSADRCRWNTVVCQNARRSTRAIVDASARSADGEAVDAQGGLTDADGHALSFLATHADALVEREVASHHAHAREHVRTVTDERGALDRTRHFAVLDEIGLARAEHELARRDVDLTAAEIDGIESFVDRLEDL